MANPYQAPLEENEIDSAPRRSFGLAGCGCAAVFLVVAIAFVSLWGVDRVHTTMWSARAGGRPDAAESHAAESCSVNNRVPRVGLNHSWIAARNVLLVVRPVQPDVDAEPLNDFRGSLSSGGLREIRW